MSGFIKQGELQALDGDAVCSIESALASPDVEERFKKFASGLKRITKKADEFLYFSATMMHSAEASLINSDGTPKLSSKGEIIKANWEKKGESLKWICSDTNVRPYKNSNGDIFPEEELVKAYRNWIGKPLCIDHKSSSVDAIRGIILDTYYDRKFKRVIALCALDKITYPDLANKVSLGYSTCVSMGTAVGRAICTDCGTVARTENDFCSHMRTKSGYGEINCDLQPIELSIVVNGADPQAKIRTIIAAANTVNNHLVQKETELKTSAKLDMEQINQLEETLKEANQKLADLKEIAETQDDNSSDAPYGQSSGRYSDPVDEINQEPNTLNFPQRYANNDVLIQEVKILRTALEERLQNMEKALQNINKEETMADEMNKKAYWQGGGGVNEPTPGQKKYPVDPLAEKVRFEDKQMNGEKPFPEVGAVDGLHPSPESVDEKDELERKKKLLRAQQEERSMRRAAALQKAKENTMNTKEAYWQGGGGVNEPTPGKPKYPVDKLQDDLREKEDKQMVGQKPFPGVGNVEGLHPSPLSADEKDELARKKLLQRASLKARWIRVANQDGSDNLGASGWHVYAKEEDGSEKLIFTASVDEISGGRSDALYDVIATKDFGGKMLEKIRTAGLAKAATVFKKGQAVAGPGSLPVAQDAGGAGATPAMPEAAPPVDAGADKAADEGGKGDPKDVAMKLAEQMRDISSDLLEAVRTLTGEQSQMGDMEEGLEQLPKAASATLAPLYKSRRQLNASLVQGTKQVLAALREHIEELELVASVVDTDTSMNQEYVNTVVNEALEDAKTSLAEAHGVKKAFDKYARGVVALVKQAEEASALVSLAEEDANDAKAKAKKSEKSEDKKSEKEEKSSKKSEKDSEDDCMANDGLDTNFHLDHDDDLVLPEHDHEHDLDGDLELGGDLDNYDLPEDNEEDKEDVEMADDQNDTMVELPPGAPVPAGAKAVEPKVAFDLSTKEGRAAFRAKLASTPTGKEDDGEVKDVSSLEYSDMLEEADKLADGETQLDVKPSDDLGCVETQEEQYKKDLEVAKAGPKVRKEAERLNELISNGTISASALDDLIAQGLDPEVVKYWKQYYGLADKEGAEFGKLMSTETLKAKAEQELNTYKVKIARAYELANEMVRRGLIEDDRSAITAQVEEIMQWNDEGFDSMKRVVAKHAPIGMRKEASTIIPQVGIKSEEMFSQKQDFDFQTELDRAFSGRKY